ncbi:hypothetical protein MuYL_3603 [Mucilaginibacter xinganensis]|uniref:Uncharacterized protein n=1 Tax=Mucilaginibacter xinganensis TaxID=1234841 RepID=A0A223P0X8_9SPHI|nr:hypothetical protein MuYL_3603 [Mucilaginibacter xinganensis]
MIASIEAFFIYLDKIADMTNLNFTPGILQKLTIKNYYGKILFSG